MSLYAVVPDIKGQWSNVKRVKGISFGFENCKNP